MNIIDNLNRYQIAEAKIRKLTEQLENLEQLRDSIASGGDGLRPAGVSDRTGRVAAMIADLEQVIETEIAEALKIKTSVLKLVAKLEDADQYAVIYARYIDGKSISAIAQDLFSSRNRVRRIHDEAVELLKKL